MTIGNAIERRLCQHSAIARFFFCWCCCNPRIPSPGSPAWRFLEVSLLVCRTDCVGHESKSIEWDIYYNNIHIELRLPAAGIFQSELHTFSGSISGPDYSTWMAERDQPTNQTNDMKNTWTFSQPQRAKKRCCRRRRRRSRSCCCWWLRRCWIGQCASAADKNRRIIWQYFMPFLFMIAAIHYHPLSGLLFGKQ